MMEKIKILVVDDEPMNRTVMTELLGGDFEIQCAEDSLSCIDILSTWFPDLILMDVKMPDIDGLDTCKQIRANPETEFIPIIFVSALGTPEERMAGYEAGGDDYVVKPYDDKELVKKIHLSMANSKKLKESQNNFQESMQAAMTAMTNTAEIGNILHFYQASFSLASDGEVIDSLLSVLSGYGLNSIVATFSGDEPLYRSSSGVVRPIEISVIDEIRKRGGSILNFGCRSAYSYSNITILVMDMPIDDEEKYGRLKDHIAMLAEGGNARIISLIAENDKRKQQNNLQEVVNAASEALQALEKHQGENQNEMESIMRSLTEDVEASFLTIGLSDEQEESLMEIINRSEEQARTLFDKDQLLRKNLEAIMFSLNNV